MKRIEIAVRNPREEMNSLLEWAERTDAGEVAPMTPQISFSSLKRLFSTITEKRLDLVRYVATHEGLNTRQLSQAVERDYKNVHEDVRQLCDLGLLEKRGNGLFAPYDEIVIHAEVRPQRLAA